MADSPETKERLKKLWHLCMTANRIYNPIYDGLEYSVDLNNQTVVIPTLRKCQEEARRFIQDADEFISSIGGDNDCLGD